MGDEREPDRLRLFDTAAAATPNEGAARPYWIRPAAPGDLEALREVERAAGRCFRDIGMPEIADDDPLPTDVLAEYQRHGRAWVAVDTADHVVAYLISDLVDDNVHIEQVSVHPDHSHRGVGRSLIEVAAAQAAATDVRALTLTTFRDVAWNAPYYSRCGFRVLDESEWTPGLRAIRDREAAHGMDRWPRVCMLRTLP